MPDLPEMPPDEFEEREQRFVREQSISERAYSEVLALASAHAAGTLPLLGAPPWRFVGPRNLGGRIISIAQDPSDPRILYVGSAHGGLWRSIDGGDTWERLGDPSHVFPVGALAVAPTSPNVLYFGTGAHVPSYVSGQGLFRALVPGPASPAAVERLAAPDPATTSPRRASPGAALRYTRIRVDPDDPTRFWAASQTGLWRCECPTATPAVPRFTRDLPNAANEPARAALTDTPSTTPGTLGLWPAHCTDVLVSRDPRDTETVPLNGRDVARYLIIHVAVDSVGVFRGRFDRRDGTTTFDGDPLAIPTTGFSFTRIRLAQCERQPQHVYAVMADTNGNVASEVFHSANNGDDWTRGAQRLGAVDSLRGQADYDLVLEVAPDDPSVVVCGEVEVAISRDFGSHWTLILDWTQYDRGDKAQHADQHIAMFDVGDHRRLWIGNDGGLTLARDLRMPVQAYGYWRKRSHGIHAGQCQDVSVNPSLPFMCAIGLQDNGSWLSLGGPTWYHVGGADGGAAAFNLASARQLVVTWQSEIERVDAVASDSPLPGGNSWYDLVSLAAGDLPETIARGHRVRYRWTRLTAGLVGGSPFIGVIENHPTVPNQLLAGRIGDGYSSTNLGAAWAPLVPGVPLVPAGEVCAMAFGPLDAHNPLAGQVDGWAGTSLGTLFFTNNAPAGAWAAVAALPFPGAAPRITEIIVHPLDRRIVAVSTSGIYGRVFLTYDQGRTWLDVTEPIPALLVVGPAGTTIQVGQTRGFTATATYPGPTVVNVTARAAWSSSNAGQATVGTAQQVGSAVWGSGSEGDVTGFGSEGYVTGVAAGAPTITATLVAGVPNGSASQPVTISAAAVPAVPLATQPRTHVPGSLPPGPIGSVIFDQAPAAGAAATLLAGSLVGVYALPNVPVVATLAIQPPGPLTFQTGAAAFQLRCDATFTDGTVVDVTRDVDWSTSAAGTVTVSNAPVPGQLQFVAVGAATITVDRGGITRTLTVNVQAAAAPAPPALPAPPAAVNPTVPIAWALFNTGLPQVPVTDFERVGTTTAIRAATFGLGVFECVTAGGPQQQLYIRQTIVEDGRTYPRAIPAAVPDDPRLPAGTVALDMTHAFDIRVDAPPYSFFDDVVDGVEFDEQLEVSDPVPGEDNYVYVQVHNRGTTDVPNVSVHLYAAACAPGDAINPIGPVATASPASLDGGAPIADFYGQPNRDPIPASAWKRVDTAQLLETVRTDAPRVARFTWRPDVALGDQNVALLALCEGPPLSLEPLPGAPAGATLSAFVLAERRAALRVVHVAPTPDASIYIRDGVADDTRLGGYPVGGRSPDIMVVHPDIAGPPADAFKDLISRRPTDTVTGTGTNIIYVRVHNRRRFETKGKVKVFAIHLDDANQPVTNTALWTELPSAAAFADVTVPPSGIGYARVELPNATDPNAAGTNKTYLLLALIKSEDDKDPLPNKDRVSTADEFWNLVSRYVDADNAAARAVPWAP